MSERALRATAAGLALAGAAIAAYLSYTRLTDTSIICPTTGCATVQRSAYSTFLGAPVAYIGVGGYLAIAATTCWSGRSSRRAGAALVIAAVLFAIYLLVAQLFVVHAVCAWCLGSDGVVVALLVLIGLRPLASRRAVRSPQTTTPRRRGSARRGRTAAGG